MTRFLIPMIVAFGFACASPGQHQLQGASDPGFGAAEVEVQAERTLVLETVKSLNDYALVVEKPDTSMAAALLFGTRLSSTPHLRVTFNAGQVGPTTKVTGRVEMVSNPGSGFENTVPLRRGPSDLQQTFENLKARLATNAN
jgi:hypothetical protein